MDTPKNQPFMRASKAVSMEAIFHYLHLHSQHYSSIDVLSQAL